MYYYDRKKELIKNGIIIGFILLIAIVSTRIIYFKYKDERNVDYNLESLEIVFHEKTGQEITINKVTPVTDNVGLSSNAYTFSITNNKVNEVKYKIVVEEDEDKIIEDECQEYLIGKQFIKISIKEGNKANKIYNLADLEQEILLKDTLEPSDTKDYSIRVWVDKDITIPAGSNLHYHGKISVIEE